MKRSLFEKGSEIQVGGMDTANVQVGGMDTANAVVLAAGVASDAFAADTIIEVSASGGADVWIAIGTAPTATANTDGNTFLSGSSTTRPFRIDKGNKIVATGGAINVTPVD
jgi:hypothetical protein